MTKDYTLNGCALSYNMSTAYNFQGFRKGMYVELLAMFLIYFAGQIYQAIKSSQQDTDSKPGEEAPKPSLPWNEKRWNKMFPIHFANHAVALGFVLLFNPMPAGLILSYIHLLFFVGHIVGELKMHNLVSSIMMGLMCLANVLLMVFGLVGVNYSNYTSTAGTACQFIAKV